MYSLPSSRHLLVRLVLLTIVVLFWRLLTTSWMRNHIDLEMTIVSQFQHGDPIQIQQIQPFNYDNLSDIFDIQTEPVTNDYTVPLLQCPFKVNQVTGTIRIPNRILNISLTQSNSPYNPDKQYFNPTLIPLPPHSPYPYLLLSRLVTQGFHQESHICIATLCYPPQTQMQPRNDNTTTTTHHSFSTDTRPCNADDIHQLGPHGGIRCATPPQRLNIPPTPALRCHGAWTTFPDIPGFHDPRVFWSGKGEPLVIVNSASRYGCVGLWVVDLRAIYPELADLMKRNGENTDGDAEREASSMSYPHLTEITRNPRGSRGDIEKNWILFFPQGDESWILYDLVGYHAETGKEEEDGQGHGKEHHVDASLLAAMRDGIGVGTARNGSSVRDVVNSSFSGTVGLELGEDEEWDRNSTATLDRRAERLQEMDGDRPNPVLKPMRTLAKLIGAGYTTPNLTASNETPCLTSDDLLDSRGDTGHWHQGSNSLRLILCTRQDLTCLGSHSERDQVEQGKAVHFSILHRKFSNSLDLPMRYERYVMVWEARFPFRMVGMSRHPILFAGEKVQPWSKDENEPEDDLEAERWKDVYFTYTPSLAWSWRRESVMDEKRGARMGQGTGYLGDEVVVGVGMDDIAQGVVKVKVEELLSCLRLCPDFEIEG